MNNDMKSYAGLYHGRYRIHENETRQKAALRGYVFPGQGSATPGMYSEYFGVIPELKELFSVTNRVANYHDLFPPSLYIENPGALPENQLHIYRNVANFCCQVAIARHFISRGLGPAALTGHSFGECAALVVCGLVDFEQMLPAVILRGLLSPPPNSLGSMLAVSGTPSAISEIMGQDGVYLANRNSPNQFVLSVKSEILSDIQQKLRKSRTPHVLLKELPQPYHSPLLNEFQKKFLKELKSMNLFPSRPTTPLFSGVSHQWIDADTFRSVNVQELLAQQITEPVDFIEQTERLSRFGVDTFYELGPIKMLEASIRNIRGDRVLVCRNAGALLKTSRAKGSTPAVSKNQSQLERSPWFKKILEAIQSITGYSGSEISVQHNFQRDLAIDSIKKAEILFRVLSENNVISNRDISISQINTLSEAIEFLENGQQLEDPLSIRREPRIDLFTRTWVPSPLQRLGLKPSQERFSVLRMTADPSFWSKSRAFRHATRAKGETPVLVLEFKSPVRPKDWPKAVWSDMNSGASAGDADFYLCLADETRSAASRPLFIFLSSLARENQATKILNVLTDDLANITDEILLQELRHGYAPEVYYKAGIRHIYRLNPVPHGDVSRSEEAYNIVCVGGAKGISLELLRRFPARREDKLFVIGRSPSCDPEIVEAMRSLAATWSTPQYRSMDISDYSKLTKAVHDRFGREKIDFFFNGAGDEKSASFLQKTGNEIESELFSKLVPFESAERLKADFGIRKLVHFGSIVAQFGNKGQATYSFANAVMEQSQAETDNPSTILSWGPWDRVGMVAKPGIYETIFEYGASFIDPDKGSEIFQRVLFDDELPPYPLLAMDEKDGFLLTRESLQINRPTLSLGGPKNRFEGIYRKEISRAEESYLWDHRPWNKAVVPVSYLLSTISLNSQIAFKQATSMRDIEISNPILLDSDMKPIFLQYLMREPYVVNVYNEVLYLRGRLDPFCQKERAQTIAFEPAWTLNPEALYGQDSLIMDEKFRFISEVAFDAEKRVRSTMVLSRIPTLSEDPHMNFYLSLFEGANQTPAIRALVTAHAIGVPASYGAIHFFSETAVTDKIHFFSNTLESAQGPVSDVFVTNDRSEVICKLEHIRYLYERSGSVVPLRLEPYGQEAKFKQSSKCP